MLDEILHNLCEIIPILSAFYLVRRCNFFLRREWNELIIYLFQLKYRLLRNWVTLFRYQLIPFDWPLNYWCVVEIHSPISFPISHTVPFNSCPLFIPVPNFRMLLIIPDYAHHSWYYRSDDVYLFGGWYGDGKRILMNDRSSVINCTKIGWQNMAVITHLPKKLTNAR